MAHAANKPLKDVQKEEQRADKLADQAQKEPIATDEEILAGLKQELNVEWNVYWKIKLNYQ